MRSTLTVAITAVVMFGAGFMVRGVMGSDAVYAQGSNERVFELRTYTAAPGKFEALKARFRNHTMKLFEKHGMTNIGYWIPADAPNSENTLIYILAYPNREAAKKSWAGFRADPEWQAVVKETQKDGPLTAKSPDSVYMVPADFSQIK